MLRFLFAVVTAAALAAIAAADAGAATTTCSTVATLASATHQWLTQLGTNCTFSQSQPAVGDLANVGGGTVLANSTGASAAPAATTTPVLGIAGTSTGSLGLANSAGGTLTLDTNAAITSYSIHFPPVAPTANGQALTATTAGVASWAAVLTARLTVVSKTSSYTLTSADDATSFNNIGAAGSVTFTFPTSPTAGDNWCFAAAANQTIVIAVASGQTLYLGNVASTAGTGNITSGGQGVAACVTFHSATVAIVESATGPWTVN
jgi:hypothetical protein